MKPLVSIVVPIYNVEKYLVKCIDSILGQSYRNLEVILVDDGSPDNSGKICDNYSSEDSRIRVIHQVNGGLSNARNSGLKVATGDYVCFFDSDDYIEKNLIELCVERINNSKPEVIVWGYYYDTEDGSGVVRSSEDISPQLKGNHKREEIGAIEISDHEIGLLGYAWNKLYKTSYLRENKFVFEDGLSLIEDIIFNSQVVSGSKIISFINIPLTHYMQRNRETLGNKFYSNYYSLKLRAYQAQYNLLINLGCNPEDALLYQMGNRFNGIKSTLRSLAKSDDLNKFQKVTYIKTFINEPCVVECIKKHSVKGNKNKLIAMMIKLRMSKLLLHLFKYKYA